MTTSLSPDKKMASGGYAAICSKCKNGLDERMHRGFFVKKFLFWLPIRRYKCYRCKRGQYVLVK